MSSAPLMRLLYPIMGGDSYGGCAITPRSTSRRAVATFDSVTWTGRPRVKLLPCGNTHRILNVVLLTSVLTRASTRYLPRKASAELPVESQCICRRKVNVLFVANDTDIAF